MEVSGSISAESGAALTLGGAGGTLVVGSAMAMGGNNITGGGTITGTTLTGTSLDVNGNADVSGTLDVAGDTTITNGLHVHHTEGIELGTTGGGSTTLTTLTSDVDGGNSQLKFKGGNYVHNTAFQTSWNSFEYAKLSLHTILLIANFF